jgi:hypothetical protein
MPSLTPNRDEELTRQDLAAQAELHYLQMMEQERQTNKDKHDAPTVTEGGQLPLSDAVTAVKSQQERIVKPAEAGKLSEPTLLAEDFVKDYVSEIHNRAEEVTAVEIPVSPVFEEVPGNLNPVQFDETEIPEIPDVELEDYLSTATMRGWSDAYILFKLLLLQRENKKLWQYIEKVAPTPSDFIIFRNNLDLLSPQFIQTVLVIGGIHENYMDTETGRVQEFHIYSGIQMNKSLMSEIVHVMYATEPEYKLREYLGKTHLDDKISKTNFTDEKRKAGLCQSIVQANPQDSRTKHLLTPIYLGKNYIIMPNLKNQEGNNRTLYEMFEDPNVSTQKWVRCLAGGVKANNLILEHGLINVDFKAGNVVESPTGGVLIDWGGFLERADLGRGKISIKRNRTTGSLYPLQLNQSLDTKTMEQWEANHGNVQRTQIYSNLHLLSQELLGQMPPGTLHKYILYRVLEVFFIKRHKTGRKSIDFIRLSDLEKLDYPPLELDRDTLTKAEQLLFDLYLRLHSSHLHPFPYIGNDTKQGVDPQYIDNEEIVSTLEQIANLTE